MKNNWGHGDYIIETHDRVIISQSFGSWNDVTINEFIKEYQCHAQSLIDQPWAGIVDVTQWQLATQEAELIAKEFESWCCKNNRQCIAIVGTSPIVNFQLSRAGLNKKAQQTDIQYFDTLSNAIEWLTLLKFMS
jgi:hypothetical protein